MKDVRAIKSLADRHIVEGSLLPLALADIYENIRSFFVVEEEGKIVGCVALHVVWEDMAEIRTLAVEQEYRGRGYGDELILAAMRETRDLEIERVFALTAIPFYFTKRGFQETDKSTLPHKIWAACVKCPKFPDCDEVAVGTSVSEWFRTYGARFDPSEDS